MLTQYVQGAMKKATYEVLPDGTFYGEIPGFRGVLANTPTLEECREELQEVLEGWIIVGLRMGHELPIVDTIDLGVEVSAS